MERWSLGRSVTTAKRAKKTLFIPRQKRYMSTNIILKSSSVSLVPMDIPKFRAVDPNLGRPDEARWSFDCPSRESKSRKKIPTTLIRRSTCTHSFFRTSIRSNFRQNRGRWELDEEVIASMREVHENKWKRERSFHPDPSKGKLTWEIVSPAIRLDIIQCRPGQMSVAGVAGHPAWRAGKIGTGLLRSWLLLMLRLGRDEVEAVVWHGHRTPAKCPCWGHPPTPKYRRNRTGKANWYPWCQISQGRKNWWRKTNRHTKKRNEHKISLVGLPSYCHSQLAWDMQ